LLLMVTIVILIGLIIAKSEAYLHRGVGKALACNTIKVCVDLERGYARYCAVVEDSEGGKATGYGTETTEGFTDLGLVLAASSVSGRRTPMTKGNKYFCTH
jgi:hypothetical protein